MCAGAGGRGRARAQACVRARVLALLRVEMLAMVSSSYDVLFKLIPRELYSCACVLLRSYMWSTPFASHEEAVRAAAMVSKTPLPDSDSSSDEGEGAEHNPHLQAQMCAAVEKGDAALVRRFLAGAGTDAALPGGVKRMPLFLAAGHGHVDVAIALLEHNADPNQATTDKYRRTPLYRAAGRGRSRLPTATDILLENTDGVLHQNTDGRLHQCPLGAAAACYFYLC